MGNSLEIDNKNRCNPNQNYGASTILRIDLNTPQNTSEKEIQKVDNIVENLKGLKKGVKAGCDKNPLTNDCFDF
ncbi:MAG: hypothetical protein H7196_04970 [candidate division SR1 bacterium]|nr:hypothetical protein [candidate division SR1 bacterium]